MTHRVLLTTATALLAGLCLAAPPKVAVVYSSWPDGNASFSAEWDDALAHLGWATEKFENTQIATLADRLAQFDLVIAASVANYEHPQDMTPYREQWLAFLDRGGCLLVTDASYGTALDQWVNTFGPEYRLTTTACIAHREGTPESREVVVAPAAITTVPNDLAPILRERGFWAHIDSWPEGWESTVTCKDEKSLLLSRRVGKGLLVVTSYFSFKGQTAAGSALLENAWFTTASGRSGIGLTSVQFGRPRPGADTATVGIRNLTDDELSLTARVDVARAEETPRTGEPQQATIPAGETAELALPYVIEGRGRISANLVIADAEGNTLWEVPRRIDVPPAVTVTVKRKHLHPMAPAGGSASSTGYTVAPQVAATIAFAPDADAEGKPLSWSWAIDDGEQTVLELDETHRGALAADIADLPQGEHRLTVRLLDGDRELGRTDSSFFWHEAPRWACREDGVYLHDGEPFFPFGFYHVSQAYDIPHRTKMVQDIGAAGFNCAHTRIMNIDEYQPFLDECEKLGVYIITEFTAPMFETIERYRGHPAVMGWNPGDEPDGQGVSPETMFDLYDRFKQLDPDHLVYTVSCVPARYKDYARGTDILAPDPYPIPNGPVTDVYKLLKQAGIEAAKYDTSLLGVLQCFGGYGGWKRAPNALELRSMTYLALLARVRGIIYYTYGDGGWLVTDNPEQWEASKALVPEIELLAPALMDGEFQLLSEGEGDIYAGSWDYQGDKYVVVANGASEARAFDLETAGDGMEALFPTPGEAELAGGRLKGRLDALGVGVFGVQ